MCVYVYDVYVCVSAQEPLLFKENSARLSGAARFFNASIQVAACTAVGCGPWSPPVLVLPPAGRFQPLMESPSTHHRPASALGSALWTHLVFFLLLWISAPVQAQRSHLWVGVLMGLLLATVVALALSFLARRRGKETHFGYGAHFFCTTSLSEIPTGGLTSVYLSVHLQLRV